MNDFSYQTISNEVHGYLYKEKGSKFICFLLEVSSSEEVKTKLDNLKILYPDATHHCYAYRIGLNGEQYRINDDGEPTGTAGQPIYNQLISADITNVLLVVVRYFGGTKLGVGGLIKAYKESAKEIIHQTKIIKKELFETYQIYFQYPEISMIELWLKKNHIPVTEKKFKDNCYIKIEIPKQKEEIIFHSLDNIQNKIDIIKI